MDFLDVIFPVNIGPLTYRCPEALSAMVKPGMIVSAPLKNRITKGIILGNPLHIPSGDMKDIQEIHGDSPVFSGKMINLLKWMSEYYLAEQGLVLKNMLPKEAFTKVKKRKKIVPVPPFQKGERGDYILNITHMNDNLITNFLNSLKK